MEKPHGLRPGPPPEPEREDPDRPAERALGRSRLRKLPTEDEQDAAPAPELPPGKELP